MAGLGEARFGLSLGEAGRHDGSVHLLTYGVLPEGRLRRGRGGGSGGALDGVSAAGDKRQPGDGRRPSGSAREAAHQSSPMSELAVTGVPN